MSEWTWVYNFRRRVQEAGDTDRIELDRLANRAIGLRRSDPDRALALLREAARKLVDPAPVLEKLGRIEQGDIM